MTLIADSYCQTLVTKKVCSNLKYVLSSLTLVQFGVFIVNMSICFEISTYKQNLTHL